MLLNRLIRQSVRRSDVADQFSCGVQITPNNAFDIAELRYACSAAALISIVGCSFYDLTVFARNSSHKSSSHLILAQKRTARSRKMLVGKRLGLEAEFTLTRSNHGTISTAGGSLLECGV